MILFLFIHSPFFASQIFTVATAHSYNFVISRLYFNYPLFHRDFLLFLCAASIFVFVPVGCYWVRVVCMFIHFSCSSFIALLLARLCLSHLTCIQWNQPPQTKTVDLLIFPSLTRAVRLCFRPYAIQHI